MSRVYYSSIFKIFYVLLISLSLICVGASFIEVYDMSKLVFLIEVTLTSMLFFETLFRGFMQGWAHFLKLPWNVVDLLVTIASIVMVWVGFVIGGGIGVLDSISAITAIIVRTGLQLFRLAMVIRRKKEQDVQIIDLNGISEGDELPQHTEKNLRSVQGVGPVKLVPNQKAYDESVDESQ